MSLNHLLTGGVLPLQDISVDNLTANSAQISGMLQAANAVISGTLQAFDAQISNALTANTASFTSGSSTSFSAGTLTATNANITSATIGSLVVNTALRYSVAPALGDVLTSDALGNASWQVPSSGVPTEFLYAFGMTAGPGNAGANDYPATIAISAAPPSVVGLSAINFPRVVASQGGIAIGNVGVTQVDNTEFILPSVGVYRIQWKISIDEAGQLSLFQALAPPTGGGTYVQVFEQLGAVGNIGRATGTNYFNGDAIFNNLIAGQAIQLRNYASAAALTVTPTPGGTQAQSVSIMIERLF